MTDETGEAGAGYDAPSVIVDAPVAEVETPIAAPTETVVDVPQEAVEVVAAESAPPIPPPSPAVEPPPQALPLQTPSIKDHLSEAFAALTGRKKARLDKILQLAAKKHSIKNDDVEKLLQVSDSSAQRYLNEFVKQGKLKRVGNPEHPSYEPV